MALYVVTVSRVVRDYVSATIEVDAESREAAEAEALRQYGEGAFELDYSESLDSEDAEAFAWEAEEA